MHVLFIPSHDEIIIEAIDGREDQVEAIVKEASYGFKFLPDSSAPSPLCPRGIETDRQSSQPAADNDRMVDLIVCHITEKTFSEGIGTRL